MELPPFGTIAGAYRALEQTKNKEHPANDYVESEFH